MRIVLSEMSPLPLREQIVRRIREMVLSGELPEHQQIPSIRSLARSLRVGVVTVQRAYEDLEREKTIYARRGKGYFVAPLGDESRSHEAGRRARQSLRQPVVEAAKMGLPDAAIIEIVRSLLAESKEHS